MAPKIRHGKRSANFKDFESVGSNGKHLRLANSMMESKAWQELTCYSITLYLHIKMKYNYKNEDDISFTYAEGEKLMSEQTFRKSIAQLINLGFIKVVREGWTIRKCTIFGLHNQWKYYGTNNFKVIEKKPSKKHSATQ
jgi:hypothetical protein